LGGASFTGSSFTTFFGAGAGLFSLVKLGIGGLLGAGGWCLTGSSLTAGFFSTGVGFSSGAGLLGGTTSWTGGLTGAGGLTGWGSDFFTSDGCSLPGHRLMEGGDTERLGVVALGTEALETVDGGTPTLIGCWIEPLLALPPGS